MSSSDLSGSSGQPIVHRPAVFRVGGIDSDPLAFQRGAIAADVMTLRLAAEAVQARSGQTMRVPEIAGDVPPVFSGLAMVEFEPATRVVRATIDTGVFTWSTGAKEGLLLHRPTREYKQGILLPMGRVAYLGERAVSNAMIELHNGQELLVWFADAPQGSPRTRYGLVEEAAQLMNGYESAHKTAARRQTPAIDVRWQSPLPEIVAANSDIIDAAEQGMRLGLDYTGGRATARTSMRMRGGPSGPIDETPIVTFGEEGPVMYWLSEPDGGLPFLVTQTLPESWLELNQRLDLRSDDFGPPPAGPQFG